MFSSWINKYKITKPRRKTSSRRAFGSVRMHYLKHREPARAAISAKVSHFSQIIGVEYRKIAIKNQKSRWGSCSEKKNLNFNYRLIFLPEELMDYVIVHELCHLLEFNHSPKFWLNVSKILPNYRQLRLRLKKTRLEIR